MAFIAYAMVSWIQKIIFQKLSKWTVWLESFMYFLFFSFYTIMTYLYYRSSIIDGIYNFQKFFQEIILNLIFIITPIIMVARQYVLKLIPLKEEDIVIRGTNKLDFLKIKQSELICISNTQNYVEVFFLKNETLKTKLIRSSLKKIHASRLF